MSEVYSLWQIIEVLFVYKSVFGNGNRLFYLIGNFVAANVPLAVLFYGMAAGF